MMIADWLAVDDLESELVVFSLSTAELMLLLLPLAACDMDGWKAGKQAQDRQTAKNKAMECIIDRLETTLVAGAEKGDYDDLCLVHWLITNDDIATR